MRSTFRLLFSVLLCAGALERSAAEEPQAFALSDYPPKIFQVTQANFPNGDVSVRVIQARKRIPGGSTPFVCRAWLETRRGDQLLQRVYFEDIDAAGFSYGIFVPKRQPLPDYFIAVKEGDYNGRLLLVAKDGNVTNLPGGFYFVTRDRRFLIGEHAEDGSYLVVIDVAQRQVVLDAEMLRDIPKVANWYRDEDGYFFTGTDESDQGFRPREMRGFIYRLDLKTHKVARTSVTQKKLAIARKIKYDFDPRKKQDCTSAPQ
jgi:hypothetical protein